MKNLFLSIVIILSAVTFGQTAYENAMNSTMNKWENAKSPEELVAVSNQFKRISAKETEKWEPLYYSILVRTLNAFAQSKDEAFKALEEIASDYENLILLADNDETKVLKGLFLTVKVAKDPMTYGATLSPIIMKTYNEALAMNPNNPRALLNLAEYEMGGAKFWGKNPKDYCPKIEKSVELFKAEEKDGFVPRWGLERAEQVLTESCGG